LLNIRYSSAHSTTVTTITTTCSTLMTSAPKLHTWPLYGACIAWVSLP
jgi:hypothetical protein